MEKYLKKYYRLFFLAVAVLLLYPTFERGYIFLLDWMVEPNISLSDINFLTDSLGWIIYKLLAIVFSFGIFQRTLLFAIIYFLGIAGFRLAKRTKNIYVQYFAGLFLIFNPFVYARLVEQINVIAGCVLFLWFLVYLLEYPEENNFKKLVWSSIFTGLAISFFPHCVFFVAISFFVLVLFDIARNKKQHSDILQNVRMFFKTVLVFGAIVIFLNGNWLASLLAGNTQGVGGVQQFTLKDVETFKTKSIGGYSIYTTVLAMQGYWGEYQDRFVSVRENPLWSPAFALILALSIFGLVKIWKASVFAKSLIALFLIAYVLAIGISSPLTKPLAMFLYNHLPFYIGLREPQKWVVIMLFVYAYFGSWGIKYFLDIKSLKNYRQEIGIFCVILPVIFSFSTIQGLHEHFTPRQFPVEWYNAKKYLDENPADSKILFFPWHSYMDFGFAGKNIINPAQPFFGKNMIQPNNTEFGRVYSHSLDEQTLAIEKYVAREDNPAEKISYVNFSADMKKRGIQAVLLAKEEDWQKYAWLDTISAKKVLENDKLIIYDLR